MKILWFILCVINCLFSFIACWVMFERGEFEAVIAFTLFGIFNLICAALLFAFNADFGKGNGFNPFYD